MAVMRDRMPVRWHAGTMACRYDGMPVRSWALPGDTADVSTVRSGNGISQRLHWAHKTSTPDLSIRSA